MKVIFSFFALLLVIGTTMVLTQCSDSTTDSSSSLSLSGTLSSSKEFLELRGRDDFFPQALSSYKVKCLNLVTDAVGVGTVADSGAFSVSLAASTGDTIGCFVVLASTGSVVATMSFVGSGTSMAGGSQTESSLTPSGSSVVMGTVSFDPSTGKAEVTKASVSGVESAATGVSSSWNDATGTWNVSACKALNSSGEYVSCSSEIREGGPPSALYLHQMGPAGPVGDVTHYGLSVWESATAYTNCGSREGVTLPALWSTADASVTNAFSFANFDTTYAAYTIKTYGDGKTACGYTPPSASTTCASVTNVQSWGNGTITFSDADCKAMCAASLIGDGGDSTIGAVSGNSCHANWDRDWSKVGAAAVQGQISNCNAAGCGAGAAANFISIPSSAREPSKRFIVGELITVGSAGSVVGKNSRTQQICPHTSASPNTCTPVTCTVTENVTMKIKQNSATEFLAEVEILKTAKGTNDGNTTICNDSTTYVDNYVARELSPQKFKMKLTKAKI